MVPQGRQHRCLQSRGGHANERRGTGQLTRNERQIGERDRTGEVEEETEGERERERQRERERERERLRKPQKEKVWREVFFTQTNVLQERFEGSMQI